MVDSASWFFPKAELIGFSFPGQCSDSSTMSHFGSEADGDWQFPSPTVCSDSKKKKTKNCVQFFGKKWSWPAGHVAAKYMARILACWLRLQAMRLENKEVDLRCSETEALIQAKATKSGHTLKTQKGETGGFYIFKEFN